MEYLSVFSSNVGKYGPEYLQIGTLYTQCLIVRTVLKEKIHTKVANYFYLKVSKLDKGKIMKSLSVPFPKNAAGPRKEN